jgi:uncharacterized membrane protein YqiK
MIAEIVVLAKSAVWCARCLQAAENPQWKLWEATRLGLAVTAGSQGVFDAIWWTWLVAVLIAAVGGGLFAWLTLRYISNDQVGVVEKLWSSAGSVPKGSIIALRGEAGYQGDLLRGGLHFGYWRWQFRVHKTPLVMIPQGKIGYVYARDGEPLHASETLGHTIACNNFQDAEAFLGGLENGARGQRGRQRAILREGVYAVNLALFVVITEARVYSLRRQMHAQEMAAAQGWQAELAELEGFDPVVIGRQVQTVDPLNHDTFTTVDSIGIVTIHDGPSLPPNEIIAPAVGAFADDPDFHNNFQDPEAFLHAGGRRGRQFLALTDGTYFINRWFATIQELPKTVVPIGYVGVVVSYYGRTGHDVSGDGFRHGERVGEGERGVREIPFGPGKYSFNTYAGNIVLVPTTNFVLHWITGRTENHRYDESLRSIDLVTRDAYEPRLPLSVVVHIDYQKAPSVIQRFGDVGKLITQTLDPLLSAYFRDIAHKRTMLELLHERDSIQAEAREELRRRFREFDIECVDVLIGKPDTAEEGGKIETLLEQLRQRQLSFEQLETYDKQRMAAERLRELNEAQAQAAMQTSLTNTRVQVQIAESQAEADLARARKQAEQTIVAADASLARARREAEQTVVLAEADSRQRELEGRGDAQRTLQTGLSEAAVLLRKVTSLGDPRLYALSVLAQHLSQSTQPLVPERLFVAAGSDGASAAPGGATGGIVGMLLNLLVAEKTGIQPTVDQTEMEGLKRLADRLTEQAISNMADARPMNASTMNAAAGSTLAGVINGKEARTVEAPPRGK